MKRQSLLSGKNQNNISKERLLKGLPSMLIVNLLYLTSPPKLLFSKHKMTLTKHVACYNLD